MRSQAVVIGRQHADSAQCRFTILGPPGLSRGDAELDLGAPQQQAVLMLLLVRSGTFVRIGELIDGLWGDRAPATGEAVIRTYISRIRRVFSEHGLGSAIRSQSGGYMLDPSLFVLDAAEFTRLVETARQERVGGAVPDAAAHLREALDLWTGTALAGVPGEAAERERSRLERLKLTAVQELLQLRLEMGEHAEVVAEVPLLIQLNRLEEPLYEIYLLALYRSGRRAEALEVYRMVYDLFGKELGVSPGPQLRAIHEKILRADTDAEDEFVPAPRPRVTTPPAGEPPGESAGAALDRNVGSRFVGRDAERAAFAAMLERGRGEGLEVFFVCGHAGIGKSTLLRRYSDDAVAAGRTVWHLHDLTTAELRERLEQLAKGVAGTSAGPVVLVDSFERHVELEPWLRDTYLRTLPADSIVVVAGRAGPSVAWITDPAWSGAIVARQLEALSAAESAALVEARGADAGFAPSIVDFAAGNPLVLSLAAEVGRSMSHTGQPSRREAVRFVVDAVLDTLLDDVPFRFDGQCLRPQCGGLFPRHADEVLVELAQLVTGAEEVPPYRATDAVGDVRAQLRQREAGTGELIAEGFPLVREGAQGVFVSARPQTTEDRYQEPSQLLRHLQRHPNTPSRTSHRTGNAPLTTSTARIRTVDGESAVLARVLAVRR
ncbi:BTAD domain-containing putative transcriptional regulator [Amycolatopsis sp. NPDC059027]|uniref:BTAD domain-containing putative transcriptional regulator n=1 Tax=Amycolatopsis sp. NPDC059027 TaxID=3346709 RepID=UPI00366AD53E